MYVVTKTGQFAITFAKGNKCGMGKRKFNYEFSVSSARLDSRHFVVDHFEVADHLTVAFSRKGDKWLGSCEQLAVSVAKIIISFIDPLITTPFVEVKLTGEPGVGQKSSGASVSYNAYRPRIEAIEGIHLASR